jgi:hypothetical protein
MTRLTAALVAGALVVAALLLLLLPAGARAQGNADISGGQCPPGWRCGSTVTPKSATPNALTQGCAPGVPYMGGCVLSGGQAHFGPPSHAEPDHSWHLLIRRSGLTKQDCEDWRDDFKGNADASAECFQ